MKKIPKLLGEIGASVVGIKIADDLFGKGSHILSQKIEKLQRKNPRAQVLWVLLEIKKTDPATYDRLLDRYNQLLAEGSCENELVVALGDAIPRNEKGEIEWLQAQKYFTQLAEMPVEEFHQLLLGLMKPDTLAQKAGRAWKRADQLAAELAQKIEEDDQRRCRRWFSRLARRVIK